MATALRFLRDAGSVGRARIITGYIAAFTDAELEELLSIAKAAAERQAAQDEE